MNKSLRVKLSVALMSTVLITLLISILVNNVFLVDYYISGKQKALVEVFNQINRMYTTLEFYEKKDSESSASNDMLFPGFPNNYFEDLTRFVDMELAMEQLSQNKDRKSVV